MGFGTRAGMSRVALGRARRRSRARLFLPLGGRAFARSAVLGAALAGWLACGPTLAAAFGAAWLPEGPPVPAAGILQGITVAIDPGHGGYDPGVLLDEGEPGEIKEGDLNLAVSLKLRDLLQRAGAEVALTRTADVDLVRPGDAERYGSEARADLSRRAEVAIDAGADVLLSLHCNAFPESIWRGAQTFYLEGAPPSSRFLAECIQAELVRATGETDRMANGRQDIFLLRKATMPAATVELGFMSNPRDLELLRNPDYQHLLALAILFGLCRFFTAAPGTGA